MTKKRRKKLPDQNFNATITGLSHDGRGIAHIDGKTIFLFGGLPNETVLFRYNKLHSRFDEGRVVEVLSASPERIKPRCAHFELCGGCSLQHMKAETQINTKQTALLELLQHQAGVQPNELLPPITGNPWFYRHKARLSIKYMSKKNKVLVGFREKNGRYVADINQCEILNTIGPKIDAFSQLFYELKARSEIPQMEVATGDNHTAIILRHLTPLDESDLEKCRQFAKLHCLHLYLQPAGPDSIHLAWPTDANPLLTYSLPKYDLQLQFHPTQFIQVNPEINQKMIAQALVLLDCQAHEQVLDLYCGIGNFSLPLSQQCAKVVGVEGSSSAVQQARANAHLNNITNCEFYCADLTDPPYTKTWAGQHFDKIVLDPPRTGAKELIPSIVKWKAGCVVYISCNPATLARDAKLLIENGYTLEKVGIMDMFPHTQHVETIALFKRQ